MKSNSGRRTPASFSGAILSCRTRTATLCAALALSVAAGTGLSAQTPLSQTPLSQSPAGGSNRYQDEIGRTVQIPARVRRIVSLAPNLTEIVFALGAGDRLEGDTDFCDYPAEAARKARVGGPINPNLEKIVSLSPDVLLATTAINRHETVEALSRMGLPVYVSDPRSVHAMIASVERLGQVLGAEPRARKLAADLRARLSALDRRLAGQTPRRVLFVVWSSPLISIGRDTFLADALRRAGARSVVETAAEWPRINLEEVIRLQPEFLVFAGAHGPQTEREIADLRTRPGWRDLEAMRPGRVVVISDAINRPAPRMVEAMEDLARALHPAAFASRLRSPMSAFSLAQGCIPCGL